MVSREIQIGSAIAVTLGVTVLAYIIWKSLRKTEKKDTEEKFDEVQNILAIPSPTPEAKPTDVKDKDLPKKESEEKMPLPSIPVLPKSDTVKSDKIESAETALPDQMQSAESNGENDNEPFVKIEKPKETESEDTEVHAVGKSVEHMSSEKKSTDVAKNVEKSVSSTSTAVSTSAAVSSDKVEPTSKTSSEKRVVDIPEEKKTQPVSVVHEESKPAESATAGVTLKAAKDDIVPTDEGAGEAMMDVSHLDEEATSFVLDSEAGAGDAATAASQHLESDTFSNASSFSVLSMPSSGQPSLEESAVGSKEPKIESEAAQPKSTSQDVKEGMPQSSGVTKEIRSVSKSDQESEVKAKPAIKLDSEVITKAIQRVQSTPGSVDDKSIKILIDLLQVKDEKLVQTALDCIVRCAAFSVNQKPLRENQCPAELISLLQTHSAIASSGVRKSDSILVSINNAIMNLSTDILNQKQLEVCIPSLIDLVMHEGISSNVQLSCLQPLTNLATTSAYHGEYTRAIQQLYILLDSGNRAIRIQALKLLVNLSCNAHVVKNLLAAKAPNCLMELLDKSADSNLTLRMTTFLANIVTTVSKEELTSESLPTGDKAASPETMFTAIFGVNNISKVKNKVYSLTRHDSEDISQQAARLYGALPK